MQVPPIGTEDDEVSIPMEHLRNGPDMNCTFTEDRRASKRTLPWDLPADELELVAPPQAKDTQDRNRPRLEKPIPTSTDESTTRNTSHDTKVLEPATAADYADSDPVIDMHRNTRATGAPEGDTKLPGADMNSSKTTHGKNCTTDWNADAVLVPGQTLHSSNPTSARAARWTTGEDAKLKDAVKIHDGKNWFAIAALVPGRTRRQCRNRWHDVLDASVHQTPRRSGKWTPDEDTKLKDAAQKHGGKNWDAIAALVPGRTNKQCCNRWHDDVDTSVHQTPRRSGKWTPDEDTKLKDAAQKHGGKKWDAIAALVPGRTNKQCCNRWSHALDPCIVRTPGRTGEWTTDEDTKLKDAVQTYNGKSWDAIAALVLGRTKGQCSYRWRDALNPSVDRTPGRIGEWTMDEDTKLTNAVQLHDGENWNAIAALVPGRTKDQCYKRWHYILTSRDDRTPGRTGEWTTDEDTKLKNAVQTHNGKSWDVIAMLVPGRTKGQCSSRWHVALRDALNGGVVETPGRTGRWTADEVIKLKDAVQMHVRKDWDAIALLIPGRTKKQCRNRWSSGLDPSVD
jgi:hypothetical protein